MNSNTPAVRGWLTIPETADYLHYSERSVHRLDIPRIRIGRRTWFDPAVLDAWLAERKEAS